MEPKFLINTTLHERQCRFYNGHECPYCGNICDYVDSSAVYQQSYGMIYLCRPCQVWVGVHHGNTDQSYGFVAKKALRDLRHETHKMFDPLWERKSQYGLTKKQAQAKARKWLADLLQIDVVECHIGMFHEEQCRKTIEFCKPHHKTASQIQEIQRQNDIRKEKIKFISDAMDIEIKEISAMNLTQFTFEKNNKKYFYNFRDNTGYWEGNKMKANPTGDILSFLEKNFK